MSRRPFPDYITKDEADAGLADGTFISGLLQLARGIGFDPLRCAFKPPQVVQQTPNDAFVRVKPDRTRDIDGEQNVDILIKGKFDRNRAVHGDEVVVKVNPRDLWVYKTSGRQLRAAPEFKDLKNRKNGRGRSCSVSSSSSDEDDLVPSRADIKRLAKSEGRGGKGDDSEESDEGREGGGKDYFRTAVVVYVSKRCWTNHPFVCTLEANKTGGSAGDENPLDGEIERDPLTTFVQPGDKFIRAKPMNKRLPWMLIQVNDVVSRILRLPGPINGRVMIPVQMMKWGTNSVLPLGKLAGKPFGSAGDLVAETAACLEEANLEHHAADFSRQVYSEVDRMVADAQAEYRREMMPGGSRRDLTKKRIFTVDPATARDLDDAVSIDVIDENTVEVGVHIADVSHYVKQGSAVDQEAQKRCTSVYLCHRMFPMLPEGLCAQLCSLNPAEPKLTFTSTFRIDVNTGRIIGIDDKNDFRCKSGPKFYKSAIKSCCRFNYDEVQDILDGKPLTDKPAVTDGHTWEEVVNDLNLLYAVCKKVRVNRFDDGSVRIDKHKLLFKIDPETNLPIGYGLDSHTPSHWLIEELMLAANRCVATAIANNTDEQMREMAVLRHHDRPMKQGFENITKLLTQDLGISEDVWCAGDGGDSGLVFKALTNVKKELTPEAGLSIENMVMKTMRPAEYGVQGSDGRSVSHYALAFPLYTHFTSPIRRYADVMVHRQLQILLQPTEKRELKMTLEEHGAQCEECNKMKKASREAQTKFDVTFFCIYLRTRDSLHYTTGTVVAIKESCLSVYIPKFVKECQVFYNVTLPFYKGHRSPHMTEELSLLAKPLAVSYRAGQAIYEWENPKDNQRSRKVSVQLFSAIPIAIVPTDTVPVDFVAVALSPFHPQYNKLYDPSKAEGFELVHRHAGEDDAVEGPEDDEVASAAETISD
ncbi:DIS3 mitotic control [Perkinsus chesapeaki]|uniref:DIS3 mitotic control n=1 Tax=Perkinsus chesapeaki TaxID=330153 RepID=A0A7J6MYR4_PERCH|nr:DIS3 mitotic control [Perkinsus chesapeaki]